MKEVSQRTHTIQEVEKGSTYWVLHLDDGTAAGLPNIFGLPEDIIGQEVTLYLIDVKDATGQHEKVVGMRIEPAPVVDIGAFEALIFERDSLRATAAALRQQMGFEDGGDGLFLKPGTTGIPGLSDAPESRQEAPAANNNASPRSASFGEKLRQAARLFLED